MPSRGDTSADTLLPIFRFYYMVKKEEKQINDHKYSGGPAKCIRTFMTPNGASSSRQKNLPEANNGEDLMV